MLVGVDPVNVVKGHRQHQDKNDKSEYPLEPMSIVPHVDYHIYPLCTKVVKHVCQQVGEQQPCPVAGVFGRQG